MREVLDLEVGDIVKLDSHVGDELTCTSAGFLSFAACLEPKGNSWQFR